MSTALESTVVPFLRRWARCSEGHQDTDAGLLSAFVSSQCESAFRGIVERHGPMVLGVCRRVLHNAHDAEDAYQAVFLVLARKCAAIAPPHMLANWLHGVALRTALKVRHRRARASAGQQRVLERALAMPQLAAVDADVWVDLAPILDEELARLPDNYRAAIVLCDLEGKSRKEAARQLNWTEGTLSGRLARARQQLARQLTARGVTLSLAGLSAALSTAKTLALTSLTLQTNIVRAGMLAASQQAVPTTLVSTSVAALAEQVIATMAMTKSWIAAGLFAVFGLLVSGAAVVAFHATDDPPPAKAAAKAPDAELHVIGVYQSKAGGPFKGRIDVEVHPTKKPVALVMTSYFPAVWNVKMFNNAELSQVLISGYNPQEVVGVPSGVPISNRSYFPADGSRRKDGWFWADNLQGLRGRELVRRLNTTLNLPISTFQGAYAGETFIIDGKNGQEHAQKSLPKPVVDKEPTPAELLKASAGGEVHIVGTYGPTSEAKPIEVEVQASARPVILVLSSYLEARWRVKPSKEARIPAVIVAGYAPQEVEGLPPDTLIHHCNPAPASLFDGSRGNRGQRSFYAYRWNTHESRRMFERLNAMTGQLVATFQGADKAQSFVVDGQIGKTAAQKELSVRPPRPPEPKPEELLTAARGAQLHVVSIYGSNANPNGDQVDVEVQPTGQPIVLALAAYHSTLWNVKVAEGAQVKAVMIGGYFEQEFQGIPNNIPIILRDYFPNQHRDHFYGFELDTKQYADLTTKLNKMTGLPIATAQLAEAGGGSYVVDGKRGQDQGQKAAPAKGAEPAPKAPPASDPLADIADVDSKEMQVGGDADKRYFLIGADKKPTPPADNPGLVVIMPGGDGSADFHPFVKRIYKNVLAGRYLVAQPVAKKWSSEQKIVWPTKTNPVNDMKFSTEEFITDIVNDVAKAHQLDRRRIYTLTWSSSGPAAYVAALQPDTPIAGSLIAMSVFVPKYLPPLTAAKNRSFYLYHSPDDRICPYRMAEQAKTDLTNQGAHVELATYPGGHGWRGNTYADLRAGIAWLEGKRK